MCQNSKLAHVQLTEANFHSQVCASISRPNLAAMLSTGHSLSQPRPPNVVKLVPFLGKCIVFAIYILIICRLINNKKLSPLHIWPGGRKWRIAISESCRYCKWSFSKLQIKAWLLCVFVIDNCTQYLCTCTFTTTLLLFWDITTVIFPLLTESTTWPTLINLRLRL